MDNLNHTALLYAAANSHKEIIQILVLNNANVNAKASGNYKDLINAASIDHNYAGGVRFINIHKRERGRTALILAADKGHKEIVEILLENNADVNAKDNDEWTALILAAENGYEEIVKILLQNNANVNANSDSGVTRYPDRPPKGHLGVTALLEAVKKDHKQIVETLLHYNASTNIKARIWRGCYGCRSREIETALITATKKGNISMVKLLVDHGAYIDAKDHYGRNALDWALINRHYEIFNILISKRDKGFWKHFLSGCETIYESMEMIIPERFLKIF